MAQSALKTAGSLLLLASIIQGLQDVPVFHYKTMEVFVGQNTSLPCFIKNSSTNIFISSDWIKKDIKLALYSKGLPPLTPAPNVTLKIVYNGRGEATGTHLEVTNINKGDAGTYVCSITTYPGGYFRTETELIVIDKIECDMNSTIELNSGENMTIHCNEFPNVTYNWFKDGVQVSDRSSLQLLSVSEASAGIYTLLANTGNSRLQTTFTIKVFTQTTGYWAGSTSTSTYNHSISSRSEETSYSPSTVFDPPHPEGQSHLVLTLCIIGGAFLIIVVLVLVRRRMIKKRMDLPPSFKPPPPPIKYTAVRNPQKQFPTDRCNSITAGGSMEMRHTFV